MITLAQLKEYISTPKKDGHECGRSDSQDIITVPSSSGSVVNLVTSEVSIDYDSIGSKHGSSGSMHDDVSEITPGLYLGNETSATDVDLLSRLDIGAILTVVDDTLTQVMDCGNHSKTLKEYERMSIDHWEVSLHTPVGTDLGSDPLTDTTVALEKAFDFIDRCMLNGVNILVHCSDGVAHSSAVVLYYLVRHFYESEKEIPESIFPHVYLYLKMKHRGVIVPTGYLQLVKSLEKDLLDKFNQHE